MHPFSWPEVRRGGERHAQTPTAALAGRLSGHRTLYTVLGQPDRVHFDDHPGERRVTAAAIRLANEVAALSRSAAATEHDVFGRQPIVLSPGVRSDQFAADLGERSGAPRILFPADSSDRRKGLDLALAAFGLLLRDHPDARLVLAGPGDHSWATTALGEDRDRVLDATDVLGVGALEDVPRRYREATVTLLPSSGEAFGLAVLESGARPPMGLDRAHRPPPRACLRGRGATGSRWRDGRLGGVVRPRDGRWTHGRLPRSSRSWWSRTIQIEMEPR